MVFDGVELLKFAASYIRKNVDYISVTYQTTSYFGNPCDPDLVPTLEYLKSQKIIDEMVFYEPDLSLEPKENELRLRNLGLETSRKQSCSHHISADVDEFYIPEQLEYAKNVMDNNNYDFSICLSKTYYKEPTWLIYPDQKFLIPFIHPIDNEYNRHIPYPEFPFYTENTRKLSRAKTYKLFSREEMVIHHMSYVRKNMKNKLINSCSQYCYDTDQFLQNYENYQIGERIQLSPDFINRRTMLVDNTFGITF